MPRQIRDTVITLAALCVLFMMLLSFSPGLRERAGEFRGGFTSQQWDVSGGVVSQALGAAMGVVSGFAADNTFMFVFLVVAGVLFVLMLRT
jgi:hypothetical protein